MDNPLPIFLVLAAVAWAGYMGQRSRKKMEDYRRQLAQDGDYVAPPPVQKMSRAQKRVEEFRAAVPPPPSLSIEEIARAEAEDLGLADLPGGADLAVNVQLIVWRRDSDIWDRCEGTVRYELDAGVAAAEATADDVRLVCDGRLRPESE
jgi:hypothetical protein